MFRSTSKKKKKLFGTYKKNRGRMLKNERRQAGFVCAGVKKKKKSKRRRDKRGRRGRKQRKKAKQIPSRNFEGKLKEATPSHANPQVK